MKIIQMWLEIESNSIERFKNKKCCEEPNPWK